MTNKLFAELLKRAVQGDNDAMQAVLEEYDPLFRRLSFIGKYFDEDCHQYILVRAIEVTRLFDLNDEKYFRERKKS